MQAESMSLFLNHIYILLTSPPGNFIYHIVLVFSIAGTLQGAIHLLRSSQFPQVRRTVFGLAILLGLQVFLFLASWLPWHGPLNSQMVLPPLDRAVTLLGLIWIVWLWAFPEPLRLADGATVLLNLLTTTVFSLTLAFWVQNPAPSFNTSIFETIWQGFSLAIVLLGIVGLALRRPNGWGNGLAMLLLAFIGHMVSLIFPVKGDFPGFVRLTQLALFPILLTLVQRFPTPFGVRPPTVKTDKSTEESISDRRRYSTDPKTLNALMSLAAEVSADKVGRALTRGIAQAMLADLCFLLTLTEDKNLVITCGYDLIREENLDGTTVNKDAIPLLANAILRGRPLRLPASSTSSDLKGLGQMLGLSNPGHLLSVPIASREQGPLGAILILSPYSNRLWTAEDQSYLANVTALFIPILERGQRASLLEAEREQARQQALSAQEQADDAKKKYDDAANELEGLHEKVSQSQLQAENMAALLVMQEESQKTNETLKAEIERLHQTGQAVGVPGNIAQLKLELRQSLEEVARMHNALADANIKFMELEQRPDAPITTEQVEVIASISQELRQPMSSIVGYTDLMLGESVGILGALQRKFIERIKASTERIGSLVDDLIQITTLETGKMVFRPELIDLNLIIDNALAYTSTQIREKNITLRLDIPDSSPPIQTDRDAFQQILIHLLQNATAATQAEGVITLRVQMQHEAEQHFISVQVVDTGGGIASEDLPRVFARRYRAEHSLIQGLGDTGVGLSIAKTLVEAQGGRIWAETEAGNGSTFSILLPVLIEAEEEK
jgi:signal transduction histidine kinase